MIKLTINNIPVEVPEGTMILSAARQAGDPNPHALLRGRP